MVKPAVLIIGGLDPQGCAGISADIQTATMHDCHPVPLITCLTEQTRAGLTATGALSQAQFMGQYHSCVADIDVVAIKIGMIPTLEIAQCIKRIIEHHSVPVVLDPVLASTSGGVTLTQEVQDYIVDTLLARVSLFTPNLPELSQLTHKTDLNNPNLNDLKQLSETLLSSGLNACLIKGGHADSNWATDYFNDSVHAFYSYHPKSQGTVRGTGCVTASSIACLLAHGYDIRDSVVLAKAYINRGIRLAEKVGCYSIIFHSQADMQLVDMPKLAYSAELIGKPFQFPSCPQRLGIYPVVDNSDWIDKLINENIKTIQLRIKNVSDDVKRNEIRQAVAYCDDSIALFINDYWQSAIELNAYGVHLGQEDLHDANLIEIEQAGLRLGVSTHSYWELARALAINPSYIALGPVFATTSKQMPWLPQGIERVKQWTSLLGERYPLVAIGGINFERAKKLKQTGVGSVAMITAITEAEDYVQATQQLIACWQ
ncbi:MAG: thiamine phosphate synthase [Gammaproteobacteria bacterium]|nr:thiamine phosphate synthase [Gammaproteobacteria bacterium]